MKVEDEIRRLYGLPLDEFIRERDELAKSVRRAGDRAAADEIKALRKPTAGAWALNQAVRRRRKETEALLAAGERLRAAHEGLLSGGDRDPLREAMAEERAVVSSLAECAEAIASETGKSGPQLRERVRATLHAAALDEETREELAAGRLTREREATGLGPLAGVEVRPAPPRSKRSSPAPSPAPAPTARADRERAEALASATRAVQDARFRLDAARTSHERATERRDAAKDAAREADALERTARQEAREAERELARRERELDRLRKRSR